MKFSQTLMIFFFMRTKFSEYHPSSNTNIDVTLSLNYVCLPLMIASTQCTTLLCLNGGTCVTSQFGLASCNCVAGYTGNLCQESESSTLVHSSSLTIFDVQHGTHYTTNFIKAFLKPERELFLNEADYYR